MITKIEILLQILNEILVQKREKKIHTIQKIFYKFVFFKFNL